MQTLPFRRWTRGRARSVLNKLPRKPGRTQLAQAGWPGVFTRAMPQKLAPVGGRTAPGGARESPANQRLSGVRAVMHERGAVGGAHGPPRLQQPGGVCAGRLTAPIEEPDGGATARLSRKPRKVAEQRGVVGKRRALALQEAPTLKPISTLEPEANSVSTAVKSPAETARYRGVRVVRKRPLR